MNNIKKRLLAVYELAQRGIDGEKNNAAQILNKLLKLHNITIEELINENDEKKYYAFGDIRNKQEAKILAQIVAKITNPSEGYVSSFCSKNNKYARIYKLTQSENIAVLMLLPLYLKAFRAEKRKLQRKHKSENKMLVVSFIYKHNIFSEKESKSEDKIDIDINILRQQIWDMDDIKIYPELPGKLLEGSKQNVANL